MARKKGARSAVGRLRNRIYQQVAQQPEKYYPLNNISEQPKALFLKFGELPAEIRILIYRKLPPLPPQSLARSSC